MKDQSIKNSRDIRRQHNVELIRRMRNGESLTSFDSKSSWYPPRPIIEKDKTEMARLYESQRAAKSTPVARKREAGNVVNLADAVPPSGGRPLDEAS
jgi:hypothetical protein